MSMSGPSSYYPLYTIDVPSRLMTETPTQYAPFNQEIIRDAPKTYVEGENDAIKMAYLKRFYDLLNHLMSLKSRGVVTDSYVQEVLLELSILELRRNELRDHIGEVVVVCNGELFFDTNMNEAVKQAKSKHGDKPRYSETIDIADYYSPFE